MYSACVHIHLKVFKYIDEPNLQHDATVDDPPRFTASMSVKLEG